MAPSSICFKVLEYGIPQTEFRVNFRVQSYTLQNSNATSWKKLGKLRQGIK